MIEGGLMKRVLFICTKNSARSQMAEAFVNREFAGKITAYSAGTEPSSVHPLAIAVMKEMGIDISHNRSKPMEEFASQTFDWVITLCDQAAETCPIFFGSVQRIYMGFEDPASVEGTEEEKMVAFRRVRDQIRNKVEKFFSGT